MLLLLVVGTVAALDVTKGELDGYFSFKEAVSVLDHLHRAYPELVSVKNSIGKTVEGRDIWSVEVHDSGLPLTSRGTLLVLAAHHARELISVSFVLWALDKLLKDPDNLFLLQTRSLV